MLSDLKISDIAIIKEAAIHFDGGLNVLTGETGAGKSIIIDSINAILGERTSRELIRTGSKCAEVSAYFEKIGNSASGLLESLGISCEEDNSLLLYRKITADGKNVCKANGESVTVSMLKKIGQSLINVHGQMDNHNLLNEDLHYTYIDGFAENETLRSEYSACYESYIEAKHKFDSLVVDETEKARKIDLLSYQINEIESADIRLGEKVELEKRKTVLQNAETLIELVNGAVEVINGSDNFRGAEELLSFAAESLSKASNLDESLSKVSDAVSDMSYSISDCASELKELPLFI